MSSSVDYSPREAAVRGSEEEPSSALRRWRRLAAQLLAALVGEREGGEEGAKERRKEGERERGIGEDGAGLTLFACEAAAAQTRQEGGNAARHEAVRLLLAGSYAGFVWGTSESVERAVRLARKAAQEGSLVTTTALAWVLWGYSVSVPGRDRQDALLESAVAAANSAFALAFDAEVLAADDQACLARLSWLMGLVRDIKTAELGVKRLLSVNSEHYMGMLLFALLRTASADYSSAKVVVTRILRLYKEDIVAALLHIVLQQVTESAPPVLRTTMEGSGHGKSGPSFSDNAATGASYDIISKDLAIMLARVEAYSAKAVSQTTSNASSGDATTPSLERLCNHLIFGEYPLDEEVMDVHVLQHRVAHYWSLLAYVCVRLGAYTLAEVVIESGMSFIANQPTPHRRAFASLLCSAARLSLLRLGGRLPGSAMTRELNLLGSFMLSTKAAPACVFSTGKIEFRNKDDATNPMRVAGELNDKCELPAVFTHLLQVAEMCPNHADAHFLMGMLRLLDASQPELPESEKHVKLLEAAVCFEQCIECSPFCVEAYLGLGNVRKIQEADDVALDLYATATELWFRQPLVPFEEFVFLFN